MWFIKVYSHFHTSLQFISTISSSPHSIAAEIRASVSIDTVSFLPHFRKYACTDTRFFPHFGFRDAFINQQFPKPVITNRHCVNLP